MAAREPSQRQPQAPQQAVRVECFERVLRAGGIEAAARPEQRADAPLVQTNQPPDYFVHVAMICCHSLLNEARSAAAAAARAALRAPITMSTAGNSS